MTIPELGTRRAAVRPVGDPHLQPHPRPARRAQAALPLPLDPLPVRGAGGRDHPAPGAGRVRARWPGASPGRSSGCATWTSTRRPGWPRRSAGRPRWRRSACPRGTRRRPSGRWARCSSTTRTSPPPGPPAWPPSSADALIGLTVADLAVLAARFGGPAAGRGAAGRPGAVGPVRRGGRRWSTRRTVRQLYWCGLATLVGDPAEIPTFDRVFALVFGGLADLAESRGDPNAPPFRAGVGAGAPGRRRAGPGPARSSPLAGAQATRTVHGRTPTSRTSSRRSRRWPRRPNGSATATSPPSSPDELARLVAVMRQLRLATPLRRSRRYEAGSRGPARRPAHHDAAGPAQRRATRSGWPGTGCGCATGGWSCSATSRARWSRTRGRCCSSSTPRPRSAVPGPRCSRSPPG